MARLEHITEAIPTHLRTLRRAQAQRSFAASELEHVSAELLVAGPGRRNVALNKAALRLGHLVGAGALDRAGVERQLQSVARRIGLSSVEARATIRSGLEKGASEPAFGGESDRASARPFVDFAPRIFARLAELCPLYGEPDAVAYLLRRGIPPNTSKDLFALPHEPGQRKLISALAAEFGSVALASTGLLKRLRSLEPDLSRFVWPQHRLGIVWRNPDGAPSTVQRRFTGNRECSTRWVFPAQRAPQYPLGYSDLERHEPGLERLDPPRTVFMVEGPTDFLAMRWLVFQRWQALQDSTDERRMIPAVVALPSATKLRPEWIRALARRHVVVALDSDAAGEKAAATIIEQLSNPSLQVTIERLIPEGAKDWADTLSRLVPEDAMSEAEYLAAESE